MVFNRVFAVVKGDFSGLKILFRRGHGLIQKISETGKPQTCGYAGDFVIGLFLFLPGSGLSGFQILTPLFRCCLPFLTAGEPKEGSVKKFVSSVSSFSSRPG